MSKPIKYMPVSDERIAEAAKLAKKYPGVADLILESLLMPEFELKPLVHIRYIGGKGHSAKLPKHTYTDTSNVEKKPK